MNLVTKCVKNNNQNFKINLDVNPAFEQDSTFKFYKKTHHDTADTCDNSIDSDVTIIKTSNDISHQDSGEHIVNNDIVIKKDEIINIPSKLNDIFDNLLENNYYLYGLSKENGFLLSLLYIISSDFKFKAELERIKFVNLLSDELCKNIDGYFSKGKYASLNFNKSKIIGNISNDLFNSEEIYYISDYYNINLVVLNYIQNNYIIGKQYDENKKNVIIVNYNEYHIPLVQMYGESPNNLIFKSVINKLPLNNDVYKSVQIQESVTKINEIKTNIEEKLTNLESNDEPSNDSFKLMFNTKNKIRALSSFKLDELQNIAKLHNIDLTQYKTKKNVYDKILELM